MTPSDVIKHIRETHKSWGQLACGETTDSGRVPGVFSDGCCGNLFNILKQFFPQAVAYTNGFHIYTVIDGFAYDINSDKGFKWTLQEFKELGIVPATEKNLQRLSNNYSKKMDMNKDREDQENEEVDKELTLLHTLTIREKFGIKNFQRGIAR